MRNARLFVILNRNVRSAHPTGLIEMNKQEILDAIRRGAALNECKAPGSQKLASEIGLRKSDWYPKHWLRWSDAVREAGCEPNSLSAPIEMNLLIAKYIDLIRELGRFPIEGELIMKRRVDKSFPNRDAFSRMGSKSERASKIREFCRTHPGFDDVIPLVAPVIVDQQDKVDESLETSPIGYVYLLRHGARREYKIGRTNNPIRREGEIKVELPQRLEPIHVITTDDPVGIETYWHRRFAEKRLKNEWFALTLTDVRAFKRWKKIY